MREANNPDDIVSARLRAVLAGTDHAVPDQPATTPYDFADTSPLTWSDIVPSWPDDVDLEAEPAPATSPEPGPEPGPGPQLGSGPTTAPQWAFEAAGDGTIADPVAPNDPAWAGAGFSGAGAFDSGRRGVKSAHAGRAGGLIAFDPGRRGVKALAVVATVVVVIAAVLAWRARPRVDPVAVPPVGAHAGTTAAEQSTGTAGADPPAARPGPSGGAEVVVAVAGKVRKPGLVRLPAGARVADALQAAGGADNGTDVALLNLARKVIDGELILVGVTPPPGSGVATGAASAPGGGPGAPAGGPVNLNTAALADLDTLPGVGPVLAQRILDARAAQGGFRAVSDLRKVDGIGDARYEQLKDLVVV